MSKKILIGSIIAICILIGVSFTSVVGYNSVESDVKASPLFNIRTNRAIDEESGDLRCEYVGRGEEINLLIPNRDDNRELLQEIFNRISKMNDKELNMLKSKINQLRIIEGVNTDNPEIIKPHLIQNEDKKTFEEWCTLGICFTFGYKLFSCLYVFLTLIIMIPLLIIESIVLLIAHLLTFRNCN
jgi:hypothetical protein